MSVAAAARTAIVNFADICDCHCECEGLASHDVVEIQRDVIPIYCSDGEHCHASVLQLSVTREPNLQFGVLAEDASVDCLESLFVSLPIGSVSYTHLTLPTKA